MSKEERPSANSPVTLPSVYQIIIYKFFSEEHIELDKELVRFKKIVFDEAISKKQNTSGNQIDFLIEYLAQCELQIKAHAEKYSIYELLYWSRRFGPQNIFEVSELTVMIYREIQTLCIYKYGSPVENIHVDENNSVYPKYLIEYHNLEYLESLKKIQDNKLPANIVVVLLDVIRIEILCFIYTYGTQIYRVVNKEGIIKVDKETKTLFADTSKDIDFLLKVYDERLSKSNLFSIMGSFVDIQEFRENESFFCPHFQLNVDHKIKAKIFKGSSDSYKEIFVTGTEDYQIAANYFLSAINTRNIYDFLKLFEDEFETYYGFTIMEFTLFLSYLGFKVFNDFRKNINAQFSLLNRAYTVAHFNLETFGEDFSSLSSQLFKIIFNKELTHQIDIVKILKSFLLTSKNQADIDIWTRGPKRFLYQVSDTFMVIDYTCLTDILSYIVKDITSKDGEIGNRRSIHFEKAIVAELESIIALDKIWVCRNEIAANGNKKEIDASFVLDDVLILLEAKAVNVSLGFDKGDKKAIDFRINKMSQALNEVKAKGAFIRDNFHHLAPNLPTGVKFICPMVISSYPEYIWEKSEELFISEDLKLPRIITVTDLKELVKIPIESIRSKSWLIKIES